MKNHSWVGNRSRPSYDPWIGSNYFSEPYRLLIVGESHHTEGQKAADFPNESEYGDTIKCTQKYLDGYRRDFWTKMVELSRRFMNWEHSDRLPILHRIAFCNFLSSYVCNNSDDPSIEAIKSSVKPFLEVLDYTRPEFVILFGVRRMRWFFRYMEEEFRTRVNFESSFATSRKGAILVSCYHPQSRRFSYERAIEQIQLGQRLIAETAVT